MDKTTIRISSKLSKNISVICLLQNKKKEDFVNEILEKGIVPYLKEMEIKKFV